MYTFKELVKHYKSGNAGPLPGLSLKNIFYDKLFKHICLKLSENTLESFDNFIMFRNDDNDVVLYRQINRRDSHQLRITFSLDEFKKPVAFLEASTAVKGFLKYFYHFIYNNSSFIKENIKSIITKTQPHFNRYNLATFDSTDSDLSGDKPFDLNTFFRIPYYANDGFPIVASTIHYSSLTLSFNRFYRDSKTLESHVYIRAFLALSVDDDDNLQVGCRFILPELPRASTCYFIDLLNPIEQALIDYIDKQTAEKCHDFICSLLVRHNSSTLSYREIKALNDDDLKTYINLAEMTCLC